MLANLSYEPFMNVEVALRAFYMLGEIITEKVTVVWQLSVITHNFLCIAGIDWCGGGGGGGGGGVVIR